MFEYYNVNVYSYPIACELVFNGIILQHETKKRTHLILILTARVNNDIPQLYVVVFEMYQFVKLIFLKLCEFNYRAVTCSQLYHK